MNEIKKYETQSPIEKHIIQSTMAVKACLAPQEDLRDAITSGVTTALYNLGTSFKNADERQVFESRVFIEIGYHFQTFTLEEIKNAFNLGSLGHFRTKPDEVLFMSIEKVFSWFKAYKFGVKRDISKKIAEIEQKEEKAKEPTQEEKEKIVLNGVLASFEAFKKTGEVKDYGNVTYDTLDKMALIPFTNQRKKEIYTQAERIFKASKIDDREFTKRLKEMSSETQNIIKAEAKILALSIFFKDLVEMEVELKDLIEEKKL
jgi:hypothetical protein